MGKKGHLKANDFLENKWAFSKADRRNDHLSWGAEWGARRGDLKLPGEGIYDNCILWEGSAFRQVKDFRASGNQPSGHSYPQSGLLWGGRS